MATTTNFGWTTPDDTDLVKDGAAAIRTLGSAIDTSLVDLKGGTTGQVLSKASNTDMDFTWSSVDPLTILDAKGDLISATAADTPARLAVGTDGQVLTADSTTATGLKWGSVTSGLTLVSSTTFTTATSHSVNNCFSSSYRNYVVMFDMIGSQADGLYMRLRVSGSDATGSDYNSQNVRASSTTLTGTRSSSAAFWGIGNLTSTSRTAYNLTLIRPNEAATTVFTAIGVDDSTTTPILFTRGGGHALSTAYDGFTIYTETGGSSTMSGQVRVYGLQNS